MKPKNKRMKCKKAIEKTIKSRAKILFKKAINEIKKSCKKGEYQCKIEIVNCLEDSHGHVINETLKQKLKSIGYQVGSSENHKVQNILWEHSGNIE